MNTIRRFWFYAVTLVALGIFAAGVERLLSLIFQITIKVTAKQVIIPLYLTFHLLALPLRGVLQLKDAAIPHLSFPT